MSLAQLAPIDLVELIERAALLERIDRKYVVARAALPDPMAEVPTGTRVLEHAGRRTHGYRSVYLDTPDLASYRTAGQRRRRRWRVRGRTYLDTGGSWLEVKTRSARDLRPVLATAYDRSTLLLPGARPSRVTIDTELGWTSLGATARDLDRPGLAIVETKGGSTPSAMDRLLWARGHRPVSISKYGVGVAALQDVSRLKWHRVLARDLGVPVIGGLRRA